MKIEVEEGSPKAALAKGLIGAIIGCIIAIILSLSKIFSASGWLSNMWYLILLFGSVGFILGALSGLGGGGKKLSTIILIIFLIICAWIVGNIFLSGGWKGALHNARKNPIMVGLKNAGINLWNIITVCPGDYESSECPLSPNPEKSKTKNKEALEIKLEVLRTKFQEGKEITIPFSLSVKNPKVDIVKIEPVCYFGKEKMNLIPKTQSWKWKESGGYFIFEKSPEVQKVVFDCYTKEKIKKGTKKIKVDLLRTSVAESSLEIYGIYESETSKIKKRFISSEGTASPFNLGIALTELQPLEPGNHDFYVAISRDNRILLNEDKVELKKINYLELWTTSNNLEIFSSDFQESAGSLRILNLEKQDLENFMEKGTYRFWAKLRISGASETEKLMGIIQAKAEYVLKSTFIDYITIV